MRRSVILPLALALTMSLPSIAFAHAGHDHGAPAGPTGEPHGDGVFQAVLNPLGDASASGTAVLTLTGRDLDVQVRASGLTPDEVHEQHVHALPEGDGDPCEAFLGGHDHSGDGAGGHDHGKDAAAKPAKELEIRPYPTASAEGNLDFRGTYTAPDEILPLTDHVVILHGGQKDGAYDARLAVACGRITALPVGGVEAGAGGAADQDTTAADAFAEPAAGMSAIGSALVAVAFGVVLVLAAGTGLLVTRRRRG